MDVEHARTIGVPTLANLDATKLLPAAKCMRAIIPCLYGGGVAEYGDVYKYGDFECTLIISKGSRWKIDRA